MQAHIETVTENAVLEIRFENAVLERSFYIFKRSLPIICKGFNHANQNNNACQRLFLY